MTSVASMNTDYDAIVIGGGVGGLVAAAYLARAGSRALLLEARDGLGGSAETLLVADRFRASLAHTLHALDGRVARELKLFKRGLALAERDMKLVALRPGGGHIIVSQAGLTARNGIVAFAESDRAAYRRFRRETMAFARRLRPLWQAEPIELAPNPKALSVDSIAARLRLSPAETDRLIQLQRFSASAYLDRWFASDAVKAALSFDGGVDGMSPHEAGSALALVWRLAQESYGVQAAVSQPKGGSASLVMALAGANKHFSAELRTGARVASIIVENGRAAGVVLESGEAYGAGAVISNLDLKHTLLELLPPGAVSFGAAASVPNSGRVASAKLILGLNGLPPVAGLEQQDLRGRLIVADRPESAAEAKGAALAGELAASPVMEVTIPTIADSELAPSGQHVMSVSVPYVPASPASGWTFGRELLANRVLSTLEAYAPGLKDRVVASEVLTPDDLVLRYGSNGSVGISPLDRLLSTYESRVRTALPGLFLCGSNAEPAGVISGRAGRIAATLASAELQEAKRGVR